MHSVSSYIAKWLIHSGAIPDEDYDLYEYAAFSFLFNLIPLFLSVIIGIALGMTLESILFVLPYFFLRTFSGGYHLKSATACFFVSTTLFIFSLLAVKKLIGLGFSWPFLVLIAVASILIFLLSPIDSEARRLSASETRAFKKIARILIVILFSMTMLLQFLGQHTHAHPMGMGIILTAVLQLPCFFQGAKVHVPAP